MLGSFDFSKTFAATEMEKKKTSSDLNGKLRKEQGSHRDKLVSSSSTRGSAIQKRGSLSQGKHSGKAAPKQGESQGSERVDKRVHEHITVGSMENSKKVALSGSEEAKQPRKVTKLKSKKFSSGDIGVKEALQSARRPASKLHEQSEESARFKAKPNKQGSVADS